VEKKTPASSASLVYNPKTMTSTTYVPASAYLLRNAEAETPEGILYITVSQNATQNSTVLVNAPGASNSYMEGEDAAKLCFDNEGKPQLSVYTLTPEREALDINLSGNFNGVEIPFGIRANVTGEIQLDFSGAAAFGHKVYLLDGHKEIDLSVKPTYKMTISKTGTSGFYEINNRFALKFVSAGNSMPSNTNGFVHVRTEHGKILLSSDDTMEAVEVLPVSGAKVYHPCVKACFLAIDVAPEQAYIVRITTAKGVVIRKVIVK
jgi:hypothetical protein